MKQDNKFKCTLKVLLNVVLAKNNFASKSDVSKLQHGKVFLISENYSASKVMFISDES
jgi:hypothetical protein